MKIKENCNLCKLWLARRKTHRAYIKFQIKRAEQIQEELKPFLDKNKTSNLKLLDIGSHRGGYSIAFTKLGYDVTGLEFDLNKIKTAKEVSKEYSTIISFVKGDATNMPFKENTFDIVILSNVIEHIKGTKKLLAEIRRVLKPKGLLYIQFPPYWGFTGGHIYFKAFPIPLHYLGNSSAMKLANLLKFDSEIHEIEKITINNLIKLSADLNFKVKTLKTIPNLTGARRLREMSIFCKIILEKQ